MAKNEAERLAAFQAVRPHLADVVKAVEVLSKLERQTNIVLGKEALAKLGDRIVDILTEALEGVPEHDRIVDKVAREIGKAIVEARNTND